MYKKTQLSFGQTEPSCIIRTTDGACIPFDPDNTDYQTYLQWTTQFCGVCEGMGVCPDLATSTIKTCPSCKGSKLNTPEAAE